MRIYVEVPLGFTVSLLLAGLLATLFLFTVLS